MFQDENDKENQLPGGATATLGRHQYKASKAATLRHGLQSYTTAEDLTKQQALESRIPPVIPAQQQQQQQPFAGNSRSVNVVPAQFQIFCDEQVSLELFSC